MKNDYSIGETKISIPPTAFFTAVGVVPDVNLCVTSDFKRPGDLIHVLGLTRDELGGSEYCAARGYVGKAVPKVLDPDEAIRMYRALHQAIREGLVASCHDVSDGGIGVALAESAFAGGFGAIVSLAEFPLHGVYGTMQPSSRRPPAVSWSA